MSTGSTQTRLPTELVELILSTLWTSILSVQDHRALLTTLPLVSHAWNTSFQTIQHLYATPKELHIISQRHAIHFINLLLRNQGSDFLRSISSNTPSLNEIESISMIIPAPRITPFDPHTFPRSPPMCIALSELLLALSDYRHRLPALRRMRIDFWNVPLDAALGYAQLRYWPSWLREVQLGFGFEASTEEGFRGGAELKRCGGSGEVGYGYGGCYVGGCK